LSGVITQIVSDREPLLFIRGNKGELESPVRGIPYGDRHIAASSVRVGDRLVLQAEPDNPHDPYAIRVLLGDKHIGYVQRDKARILSREMSFGRQVQAFAKTVKPATTDYPFPSIEIIIELGQSLL
jgi:hypothetical protein